MPIRFVCPYCNESLKVPDHFAGRKGRCPYCNAKMRIPEVSGGEPEPMEPPDGKQLAPVKAALKPDTDGLDPFKATVQAERVEPDDADVLQVPTLAGPASYDTIDNQLSAPTTDPDEAGSSDPLAEAFKPTVPGGAFSEPKIHGKSSSASTPQSQDDDDYIVVDDAPGADAARAAAQMSHPMDTAPTQPMNRKTFGGKPATAASQPANDDDYIVVEDAPGADTARAEAEKKKAEAARIEAEKKKIEPARATSTVAQQRAASAAAAVSAHGSSAVRYSLSALEENAEPAVSKPGSSDESKKPDDTDARRRAVKSAWGPLLAMTALVVLFLAGFLGILWHAVREKQITSNEAYAAVRIRALYSSAETWSALRKKESGMSEFATQLSALEPIGACPMFSQPDYDGYRYLIIKSKDDVFAQAVPVNYGLSGRKTYAIRFNDGRLIEADNGGQQLAVYPDSMPTESDGETLAWFLGR
ncbi:MAG: hypothetical protein ABIH86_06910 [Planctomycetota bacterium]